MWVTMLFIWVGFAVVVQTVHALLVVPLVGSHSNAMTHGEIRLSRTARLDNFGVFQFVRQLLGLGADFTCSPEINTDGLFENLGWYVLIGGELELVSLEDTVRNIRFFLVNGAPLFVTKGQMEVDIAKVQVYRA